MGRRIINGAIILLALCLSSHLEAKSIRKKRYISSNEFPIGGFSRAAVESSPVPAPKLAALKDALGNEEFGSKRLPLRSAVEYIPAKHLRLEAISKRLPMRDAVERRPPAYDDDLFALTDELESLGIDPWATDNKQTVPPHKYQQGPQSIDKNHYVIQTHTSDRDRFAHVIGANLKQSYYGAAKPYNTGAAWLQHYAAYQPQYSGPVDHFRIDNAYQQLVTIHKRHSDVEDYLDEEDLYRRTRNLRLDDGRSPHVVCYIESWATYRKAPMSFASFSLPPVCTHVLYAFATLDPETFTLLPYDREYDIIQGGYRMVTGLKNNQLELKVLISIGGEKWAGAKRLSQLAASSAHRANFIHSAISFCKLHGFDGLDLHWQYPGAEDYGGHQDDKKNLVILLKEMKEAFDPENLIITMAVPASRFRIEDGYEASSIKNYVEFVTLEAFDLRVERGSCSVANHHSPLLARPDEISTTDAFYSVDYAVRYWLKLGMPPSKIVLGVPLYGRSFKLEDSANYLPGSRALGLGEEGEYTQTKGLLAYFELCDAFNNNGWKKMRDEVGNPYAVFGNQWIGYDDKTSIANKMEYVKKMRLAGGAVWAADMDDFRGLCGQPWPLLSALSNTLRGKPSGSSYDKTKMAGNCEDNDDTITSDPNNCAIYYICRRGVKYQLQCHVGTLFDAQSSYCRVMDPSMCLPGQSVRRFMEVTNEDTFNHMDLTQEYHQFRESLKKGENKKVVCYVTNWSFYRKDDGKFVPEHLDGRLCTHVVYAFAALDPEKLIAREFDPWADIDNNLYARITALKDLKVLLGIGGWTDSAGDKYSRLVSSGSARRNFVTNLVAFLRRYEFNGLHLDWNYPKCWQSNCGKGPASDRENFAKLIQEISTEFNNQNPKMELGVALSGYKEVIDVAYDLPTIGRYADFLSAMTYDYHGGWEPTTSHGSPLYARPGERHPQYSTDYAIKYLIAKGAPAEKLLLGLAFYGQSFQLEGSKAGSGPGSAAVGPGRAGDLTKQPGMLAYYEICYRVKMLRWQNGLQDGAGPYAQNGDQWIGYEDVASITDKVEYANQQNLGGVVAWTVDLDDFNNICCAEPFPLLRAANRALGRKTPSPPTTPCDRPAPPVTPAPPVLTTVFDAGASMTTPWSPTTSSPTTTSPWWTPDKLTSTTTTTTARTTTTAATTTTARTTTTTQASTTLKPVFTSTTPASISSETADSSPCMAGSYSPDPGNCGAYIICSGGERRRQQCAPGLHWNAAAMLCDWPAAAQCTPAGSGSIYSSSSSTSGAPMMTTIITTQKMTTIKPYIPSVVTTETPTTTTQKKPSKRPRPSRPSHSHRPAPTKRPHKPCVDGAYYPHKECDMFNICVNNILISQSCAPGLAWNQELTMCDLITRTPCAISAVLKNYPAALNAPCENGQFSSYPGDCTQYQMCLWGKYEPYQCAPGLHWNQETNICDWPSSAKCTQTSTGGQPAVPDTIPDTVFSVTTTTTKPVYTTSGEVWTTPKPTTTSTEQTNLSPLAGYYKIVCYFTNWAWYRRGIGKYVPENIDPNLCTHIVYGFAVLDYENLIIKAHDSWADFDNKFYERVTAFKKKGAKVSLALGGWNDSAGDKYSRLVNNAAARARFINHAVGFLIKYNFDGLDLDWEYPQCWQTDCSKGPDTDKAAFTAWVRELSTAFQPHGLLLSAAVSASKTVIDAGYDVPALAEAMDWIAVMTYDYHGQWDKKTGHVAPLYYHPDDDVHYFNSNYSIRYWISEGAPPRKLVMGMPFYGQSFTLGTSWDTPPSLVANKDKRGLNVPARAGGQAGEYTRAAGFLAYYEICDRINNQQWTVEQDEEGRMGPRAYKGDQWVGFDDRSMIKKKSEFVRSLHLGGAMIWALDLDDFKNSCGEGPHPLLNAIREVLGDAVGPGPALTDVPATTMKPVTTSKPVEPSKPELPADTPIKPIETPVIEAVEAEEDISEETSDEVSSEEEIESYKVVCYFTNWAWYRQGPGKYLPDDIDPSLCTHILYGFAVLDTQNLIIKPHDSWADIDNKFYEKVTALRAKGVKVLLALGGWNDSAGDKYSKLVNNPSARRRFVIHALDFVVSNNFDGLDLDWEYPVCWQVECTKGPASDKDGFSALVRELKAVFGPKNLLLSAAVSPNRKVIDAGYDVPVLSENLDWIAVMTYDYHGQWDKKTGHVAPMYALPDDADQAFNVNYTIHHWLDRGASRSKLVLGLSLYGQSFSLASSDNHDLNAPTYGGGEAGDSTRARGFLSYYEICERIQTRQWNVVRDPRGRIGPYAYKGDQWVSFDDVAMIRHKSSYIKAMGLAGGMVWALDLDDFRGTCNCEKSPLLSAAARELGLIKTPQPKCQLEPLPGQAPKPPTLTIPAIPGQEPLSDSQTPQDSLSGEGCKGRIFLADPLDCNKYYLCNQGVLQAQRCPANLHWNNDRCDWPSNSRCTDKPGAIILPIVPPQVIPTTAKPLQPTVSPIQPAPPIISGPTDFKVVCYYTNWAWYRQGEGKYSPDDIESDLCTHIAYGFAVLDSVKLTITPHDSWADIDNDFYGKVTALRAKGKKVVIALGGWNDSLGDKYSRLVNNPNARAMFITNAVEFIKKWHFDGLDLDWEYPKCWQVDCNAGPASDREGFTALVRELKAAFKPHGWLLSAAVSASKAVIDAAYDVPALGRDLDWIAIMTYDYHGHWDRKTGHVAPLYYYPGDTYDYFNANYSVNYWMQSGAPANKLVMGIPMYGQSFTLVDSSNKDLNAAASGPGEAGEYTRAPGFLAYYEICEKVKRGGWSVNKDPENRVGPWARRGTQWVSFDDTHMATRKSTMIKSMGLGGAMVWALDLDDFRNRCGCGRHPILHAINAALRSQSPPTCDL